MRTFFFRWNQLLKTIPAILVFSLLAVTSRASAQSSTAHHYIIFQDSSAASETRMTAKALRAEARATISGVGGHIEKDLALIHGHVAKLTDRQANKAAQELARLGLRMEPDQEVHSFVAPNDTYYASQQADLTAINMPQAWATTTGSSSVVVGILDTGIDYSHPDLAANMWKNSAEVNGAAGVDDDGDGIVDDVYGANFVGMNGNPYDDNMHGTHVAGTIGAVSNNGVGVAGINWNVKLMGIKVLSASGSGSVSSIILGIQYAIMMKQRGVNIRVLNASLGGGGSSTAFQLAITQAANAGILFVAAAGNSAANNDVTPSYPANYNNVLTVAATDNAGALASFSNYGANSVQVAAPGVRILSTIPVAKAPAGYLPYAYLSGTSMACPHVAGLAALMLAASPSLTPAQLITRISQTGTPFAGLSGKVSTGSLINAAAAVVPAGTLKISGQVAVQGVGLGGVVVSDPMLGSKTTDANGNFSFDSLASGTSYTLSANKTGYSITSQNASGTLSADTVVNFAAAPLTYTLSGSVSLGGLPLAGVVVSDPTLGSQVTDAQGAYSFSAVPFGTSYFLTAVKAPYIISSPKAAGFITANTSANFVASSPALKLSGTLLLNGRPFAGVRVSDPNLGAQVTDANGRFSFTNVASGARFVLTLTKTGYKLPTVGGAITKDTTIKIALVGRMAAKISLAPSKLGGLSFHAARSR